jgi:hypothetical protein
MADIATKVLASMPGTRPGTALPMLRALAAGPLRAGNVPHAVDALLEQRCATPSAPTTHPPTIAFTA